MNELDESPPQRLVEEIQLIAEQYAEEVPGIRRRPERIGEQVRERIRALSRLRVTKPRVAELTSLPQPRYSTGRDAAGPGQKCKDPHRSLS